MIAEKFESIVNLGEANSRMKDFYDILFLAGNNRFISKKVNEAIFATFKRRESDINNRVFIYHKEYIQLKSGLWRAFLRKIQSDEKLEFSEVILKIKSFIEPVISENKPEFVWEPENWTWLTY